MATKQETYNQVVEILTKKEKNPEEDYPIIDNVRRGYQRKADEDLSLPEVKLAIANARARTGQ